MVNPYIPKDPVIHSFHKTNWLARVWSWIKIILLWSLINYIIGNNLLRPIGFAKSIRCRNLRCKKVEPEMWISKTKKIPNLYILSTTHQQNQHLKYQLEIGVIGSDSSSYTVNAKRQMWFNPILVNRLQNQSNHGHEHRHSGSVSQFDTHPTGVKWQC